MQDMTRFYLFAYAALLIVGGIMGAKSSVISLIAGIVCGLLAGVGAFMMASNAKTGLIIALVGAVMALGGMLPRFLKSQVIWPAGVVAIASGIALILTIIALLSKGGKG